MSQAAKTPQKQAAKPGTTTPKASTASRLGWIGLSVGLALACAFFASTSLLVIVGMLPTFVAFITDRTRSKSAALSICVLNFAGVLPFIINLWRNGQGLAESLTLLTQPYCWLVMYGTAGIGWAIYHYLPKFIATYVAYRAQSQLGALQGLQKKMLEKWGPSVSVLASRAEESKKRP